MLQTEPKHTSSPSSRDVIKGGGNAAAGALIGGAALASIATPVSAAAAADEVAMTLARNFDELFTALQAVSSDHQARREAADNDPAVPRLWQYDNFEEFDAAQTAQMQHFGCYTAWHLWVDTSNRCLAAAAELFATPATTCRAASAKLKICARVYREVDFELEDCRFEEEFADWLDGIAADLARLTIPLQRT